MVSFFLHKSLFLLYKHKTHKVKKLILQDGQNFETIRDDQGIIIIYQGNIDSSSCTEYQFNPRMYRAFFLLNAMPNERVWSFDSYKGLL